MLPSLNKGFTYLLTYLRLLGQKILTPSNTVASVKSSLINHDASHFSVYYFNSTFVGCFASGVSLQRQIGKVMRMFLGKQADKCGNSSFVRKSKEDSCFATRKQYPILNDKATENKVKLAWRTILTDMLFTNKSPLPSWNSIKSQSWWSLPLD